MSLVYPDGETDMEGKTSEKTDRFRGKIAQFISNSLVVWKTVFNSDDSAFAGEMTIRTHMRPTADGTEVTMMTDDIPVGIGLEDNELGCRQTLEQRAAYLKGQRQNSPFSRKDIHIRSPRW